MSVCDDGDEMDGAGGDERAVDRTLPMDRYCNTSSVSKRYKQRDIDRKGQ